MLAQPLKVLGQLVLQINFGREINTHLRYPDVQNCILQHYLDIIVSNFAGRACERKYPTPTCGGTAAHRPLR